MPPLLPRSAKIWYGLGLSVLLLVGFSIAIFSRYDLTRERHAEVRARLDARKAGAGRILEKSA